MITIYNIRGTNGSGKSTLARSFIAGDPALPPNRPSDPNSPIMVDLARYPSPTKKDPSRHRSVEGYASPRFLPGCDVLVVGSYRTACGGLDGVPNFDATFKSLNCAISICRDHGRSEHQAIIAEGVLASTVWGSWGDYAKEAQEAEGCDVRFAFVYLDTPLEVCLERIRKRQEAAGKVREIKADLVADKIKAIAATRRRAIDAGHIVYDLPYGNAEEVLRAIMRDGPRCPVREQYRAR